MYKNRSICLVLSLAVLLSIPLNIVNGQASIIDRSSLESGIVSIEYDSSINKETKVVIKKGNEKYTYDLNSKGVYPLTLGNGGYEVSVMENVSGSKYKVVEREDVTLNLQDSKKVFLQSVQLVNWNENMSAVKKAQSLVKGLKSDSEKATAIYNYVVKNFSYDYSKAGKVDSSYVPDLEAVYNDSEGICYDFATLYAAMLRSVGIPAKLLTGYKDDVKSYHSWNQVYLKDSGKWVTVDTTYDSILLEKGLKASMIKGSSAYKVDKVY